MSTMILEPIAPTLDRPTSRLMERAPVGYVGRSDLPSEDDVPMETAWHRSQMNLLIDSIDAHWAARSDFYSGGNMFVYFSPNQERGEHFRGPDFFVVKGVPRFKKRDTWTTWDEGGRGPDLIVELLSPSTRTTDLGIKKDTYEQVLRVPEYFCYDPVDLSIRGWRLDAKGRYAPIAPNADGRFWSEQLRLWIGRWDGAVNLKNDRWLRFFTPNFDLVMTSSEARAGERDLEQARADREAAAKEAERLRADREAAAKEAERLRADREAAAKEAMRMRAKAAESQLQSAAAEIERLRQQLADSQRPKP